MCFLMPGVLDKFHCVYQRGFMESVVGKGWGSGKQKGDYGKCSGKGMGV